MVLAPFTAGLSLYLTYAATIYSGVQAAQAGQFGAWAAGFAVSMVLGFAIPVGDFANPLMQVGVGALRGAAIGAISGGAASVIGGGSFGEGAAQGAMGGAQGGAISAFATSQQYQNWSKGNGFKSNAVVQAEQRRLGNLQAIIDENRATLANLNRAPTQRETEILKGLFPNLKEFGITGEPTFDYNCIARTIGKTNEWVWPGNSISDFDNLYGSYGYTVALRSQAQIALFTQGGTPTHGAIHVTGTWWESKLGASYQIMHKLEELEGGMYGDATRFYSK